MLFLVIPRERERIAFFERDGSGSVGVIDRLGSRLPIIRVLVLGLRAVGVLDGKGVAIERALHLPNDSTRGAAAPFDGYLGLVVPLRFNLGVSPIGCIFADEPHDGILAVGAAARR